ncbi:hypothetical protein ACF3NG_02955 [Aerococcaceae bacterium WGS1372]
MNKKDLIRESGLTIYDEIPLDSNLYLEDEELKFLLEKELIGLDLSGLAPRTRSKVVKTMAAEALGYEAPKSFEKTQPRFPGQNFDTYVQLRNNLQVWNEELDGDRRYVLIRPNEENIIEKIKIVNGEQLAALDRTGTLTSKFQAVMPKFDNSSLLTLEDTPIVKEYVNDNTAPTKLTPIDWPVKGELFSIQKIYETLIVLVGRSFPVPVNTHDRLRAEILHTEVCKLLGYSAFLDDGQFPDIKNQLLEVKTQTSPTIDLGLHLPSDEQLVTKIDDHVFISKDVRYAIFDCDLNNGNLLVNRLYVVNGLNFHNHFAQFQGRVENKKIQIPLPSNFFED